MLHAIMLVLAAASVTPARPQVITPDSTKAVLAQYEKDRVDTREWLESAPSSYFSAVARRDFEDQTVMSVGRAPGNDLRLDDPLLKPNHLRVTVQGDSFTVEAVDEDATFKVDDQELRHAKMTSGRVFIGRLSLRLSHQGYPGIIISDPESDQYKKYHGIEYFPPDLNYRFVLPLTRNPSPDTLVIMSTRGNQRRAERVGWFDFMVGKQAVRLEATRLLEPGVGEDDFGVFFRDATSGKESYALGRYVNVEKTDDGRYILDFNMAYAPACAYSPHYNCPIPPKANRLKVAIRAGEMDGHYMDH
jgi:uncharacterized protein (DUF1684 family)